MIPNAIMVIFANIVYVTIVQAQSDVIGDRCTVSRTGGIGSCALISNCLSILDDIRNQRYPTVCGYDGLMQIVCCPVPPTRPTVPTPTSTGSISARKCNEYKEAVYETQYVRYQFGSEPIPKKVSTCSFKAKPFIFGGSATLPREFPHMALIGYQRDGDKVNWICGGTLISEQFVMTAGHCMESRDFGPARYVKLGDHSISRNDDDADPLNVNIIQRIKHPDYRPSSTYNDIGLLKLQQRIVFNRYIRPACLPDASVTVITSSKAIATGWGLVENNTLSDSLLKVTLEIFSYADCNDTFVYDVGPRLRNGIVDATQLCAGSHTDNKDTCNADSGGPLQIYHRTHHCMYSVIGITSFGKACGFAENPAVYTRVTAFVSWIESVVWPQSRN